MPGIHEADESQESSSTEPSAEIVAAATADDVNSESNNSSETPPKEANQTDKINNFLLKSFLQHINNQQLNAESTEGNSNESEADWN